jgi:hypothetical protein
MPTTRSLLILLLLALIPGTALAHGEEVLLFPFGTLIAVVAVIVLGVLCKIRWPAVVCAALFSLAASLPFWTIPSSSFPSSIQHTGWGHFVVGFGPSIVAGVLAVWLAAAGKRAKS